MLAPTYWLNNTVVGKKVLPTWKAIQFPNEEGKGMDSTTQEEGSSKRIRRGPLWQGYMGQAEPNGAGDEQGGRQEGGASHAQVL